MTRQPDREQDIFADAMDRPPAERKAFIENACAGDQDLRDRVQSLLDAVGQLGDAGFLDKPTGGTGSESHSDTAPHQSEQPGAQIGPYQLIKTIGEGGFGTVYLAQQSQPIARQVALKVIKPGMDTRQVIARFEAERQALALMDHPGIARVYDAGATSRGRPYFVMELVDGTPITAYADEHNLSLEQRLRLFQRVCAAVQHAHQKGVIHRDLKPSNVLITETDAQPAPKVIDFGVAKATGEPLAAHSPHTAVHQVVGTPAYMSPEQAGHGDAGIDTRSDVYSLGVLLYELLTANTPLEASTAASAHSTDVMQAIREVTPPRPSTYLSTLADIASVARNRRIGPDRLPAEIRGDLDWIVMRALEKDPERRYESPGAFAADISRYLANEPVEACPPSLAYTAGKFARRHRLPIAIASVALLAIVSSLIAVSILAVRALESERNAIAQTEISNRELARATEIKTLLSDMLTSVSPDIARGRDTTVLRSILDATSQRIRDDEITDRAVRDDISATIAEVYRAIGAPETALEFSRDVYQSLQSRLGPDAPQTIAARSALAINHEDLGQWDDARALLEENIQRLSAADTPDQRLLIENRKSRLNLIAQGPPNPENVPEFEALVSDAASTLGDEDPITLDARHALARQYSLIRRIPESHAIMTDVVEIMRRTTHADDPALILAMNTLGANAVSLRRFDEAEPLILEALDRGKRVLGEDHPRVPSMMDSLAYLYMLTDRPDESVAVGQESLAIRTAALGPDHPAVIGSKANLGGIMANAGQSEQAIPVLQDALERARRVFGPRHAITLRAINNLGSTLVKVGRNEQAKEILEEALAIRHELYGPTHPNSLPTTINLARVYEDLGDLDRAAQLYKIAYEANAAANGTTHQTTRDVAMLYVPVLLAKQDYTQARTLMTDEMPGIESAWGPPAEGQPPADPRLYSDALIHLARSTAATGDPELATSYYELALAITRPDPESELSDKARYVATHLAELLRLRHASESDPALAERAAELESMTSGGP